MSPLFKLELDAIPWWRFCFKQETRSIGLKNQSKLYPGGENTYYLVHIPRSHLIDPCQLRSAGRKSRAECRGRVAVGKRWTIRVQPLPSCSSLRQVQRRSQRLVYKVELRSRPISPIPHSWSCSSSMELALSTSSPLALSPTLATKSGKGMLWDTSA